MSATKMRRKKQLLLSQLKGAGKCSICNGIITEDNSNIDHIIPISKGGKNRLENLILVHHGCNRHKNNRILAYQILHKYKIHEFNYLIKRINSLHGL